MTTKKFKAILCDLDGTLADTLPLLYAVYLEFLRRYGHEGSQEEFRKMAGHTIHDAVGLLSQKYHLSGDVPALLREYRQILAERYVYDTRLFEGVLPFLAFAKAQGLQLALVTSATERLACAFLDEKKIADYFECVVTTEDLHKSKPDPAIYLRALDRLGLAPEEAVAIEDSAGGIQASTTAGIYTLHLTHQPTELNRPAGVRLREVSDWSEIQEIFRRWYLS